MQNQNIGLYKRPGQAGSPALASGHLGAPAELTRSWDIGSVAQRSSRSGSCHANLQVQIPIFFSVLKMSCIILLIESQKRQKYSMSPICQYPERPPMDRAGISAQLKTIAFNQWDFSTLNVKRWTFLSLSINSLWTWFTHNRSSCGYKSLLNQIRFVG